MGRYIGASCKICRRSRVKLYLKGQRCETAKCAIEKRNFPPGPKSVVPKKLSEFGRRLREKQKLRFFYGVTETSLRNSFKKALQQKGVTGHNLLSLLERRIDNVVFRTKFGRSRKEARQLVRHAHFVLNGKKVTVPSLIVKQGDVLKLQGNSAEFLKNRYVSVKEKALPNWVSFNDQDQSITILHSPQREEIDVPVEEQLIIEYYAR